MAVKSVKASFILWGREGIPATFLMTGAFPTDFSAFDKAETAKQTPASEDILKESAVESVVRSRVRTKTIQRCSDDP